MDSVTNECESQGVARPTAALREGFAKAAIHFQQEIDALEAAYKRWGGPPKVGDPRPYCQPGMTAFLSEREAQELQRGYFREKGKRIGALDAMRDAALNASRNVIHLTAVAEAVAGFGVQVQVLTEDVPTVTPEAVSSVVGRDHGSGWKLLGRIFPSEIRVRVYEPALYDILGEINEARLECRSPIAHRWIDACLIVRGVFLLVNTLAIMVGSPFKDIFYGLLKSLVNAQVVNLVRWVLTFLTGRLP